MRPRAARWGRAQSDFMSMQLLAEAAGADPMISGSVVIGIIGAITTLVVGLVGKLKVDQARRERTSTRIEGQPISVELVETLATKAEMRDLEGRLVAEIKKLEGVISGERAVARTAVGNLHARIDKTAEGLAATTATMTQLNANLNRVLDLLLKRPTAR